MEFRLRKIEYYDTISATLSHKVDEEYILECREHECLKEWIKIKTVIEKKEVK